MRLRPAEHSQIIYVLLGIVTFMIRPTVHFTL